MSFAGTGEVELEEGICRGASSWLELTVKAKLFIVTLCSHPAFSPFMKMIKCLFVFCRAWIRH